MFAHNVHGVHNVYCIAGDNTCPQRRSQRVRTPNVRLSDIDDKLSQQSKGVPSCDVTSTSGGVEGHVTNEDSCAEGRASFSEIGKNC